LKAEPLEVHVPDLGRGKAKTAGIGRRIVVVAPLAGRCRVMVVVLIVAVRGAAEEAVVGVKSPARLPVRMPHGRRDQRSGQRGGRKERAYRFSD